jgi:tetratricopeptide (TPR) repeat protein
MKRTALCIIVEGDKKLEDLKIAVGSAAQYLDEVCITTNGKETEKTKVWCKENGYKHSHLPWDDDFAKQRNFNFSQVSKEVEYIFWIDSDDEVIGAENIPKIIQTMDQKEMDTIFLTYWYGCSFKDQENRNSQTLEEVELFHNRERIIRRDKYYWKGRLHETPVHFEGMEPKYTGIKHLPTDPHPLYQIAVLHRDATRLSHEANANRNERNRRILEKQYEEEEKRGETDPRTVLYLMKVYKQSGTRDDLIKCISYGEDYLKRSGWDEERSTAYVLISDCFYELGHFERAKGTLLGALEEWPHNKEIMLGLANVSFALKKYNDMKLYMDLAESMDVNNTTSGNRNVLDYKFKGLLLDLKYNLYVSKEIKKAVKAAREIYKIEPNTNNEEQVAYLEDLNSYNEACRNIDEFTRYLADAKLYKELDTILNNFPEKFKELPFYDRLKNKYGKPRVWGEKEICYYASIGGPHFEKWDPSSMKSGIGGSETAVIRLAQEWAKKGYKVTVYGDPKEEGIYDGVEYLSYTRFNPKDRFNIFIQWRAGFLANKISCKKFLVDLHDVWHEKDYLKHLDAIDKFIVKSKYHRDLAPSIPDDKFVIVSNGI